MFAISDGTVIDVRNNPYTLFDTLFHHKYRNIKFMCFNLKYDEGSILHFLPPDKLNELRQTNQTTIEGYAIRSIPKKELVIRSIQHKQSIAFYDIAQFYGTSLNNAALFYLGKEKVEMSTKIFTRKYVNKYWHTLAGYCTTDAKLTQELADFLIDTLINEFDIYPQKLYSCGYIAGIHFARTCGVQDVNRYFKHYKGCLEYAYLSYAGGKFETYQRGFGYFYQYDINSAYPYEMSNLQSIKLARVVHSERYQAKATYGFIKCNLMIYNDYSPVPIKYNNVNHYPIGDLRQQYLTKEVYDYMIKRGDKVTILDAYWLFCSDIYPYKKEIERLYKIKKRFKEGQDIMRYLLTKTLLNAFYGKHIQITEKYRDTGKVFEAGYQFNPIYASIITANTRLRLTEVCDKYDAGIVAVHTDSVVTTIDLSGNGLNMSDKMGAWALECEGFGVIVGSGVYQIGDKVHYRGYKAIKSLIDLIYSNRNRVKIPIDQTLVLSWRLVVFRNADTKLINRFTRDSKLLNLHFDTKRDWAQKWVWSKKLVQSEPFIQVEGVKFQA